MLPSKSVPGLKEHGVGDETVVGLMEAPCRRTTAVQRLAAHVPGKKNCYREAHVDHRHDVREGGGGGLTCHHCDAMKSTIFIWRRPLMCC